MQCCQSPATLILKLLITILIGLLASRYQSKRNWTEVKMPCIDAYLLVVSWRFRRFTQGHNVVHQKLLQSAMRQWTASWCILVAQQALNLHQKWLAPVYQQWPFHQQCAAGHCWWWILSVLDNFNFLLREFYQSSLKNLERILDFSLFSTYTFWSFIQSAPQKQHFNHLAAKNDFEN